MPDYEGPERRSGTEFCFSLSDPQHEAKIMRATGLQTYSSPVWQEGKRPVGRYGRHFIPLKGKEPADVAVSGQLENVSIPPSRKHAERHFDADSSGPSSNYSTYMYFDRRVPNDQG